MHHKLLNATLVAGHAVTAAGRVIKAAANREKITVACEEQDRRLAICAGCEFFTGTACKKCGCVVRFKTALATEHCPIDKW